MIMPAITQIHLASEGRNGIWHAVCHTVRDHIEGVMLLLVLLFFRAVKGFYFFFISLNYKVGPGGRSEKLETHSILLN